MKKLFVLGMTFALACCVLACSEDEGTTESELAASMCDKTKECDPDDYAFSGGDEGCADMMENLAFSGLFCPDYDANKAAECQDALEDQGCDDYNDEQPTVCDEVCGELLE